MVIVDVLPIPRRWARRIDAGGAQSEGELRVANTPEPISALHLRSRPNTQHPTQPTQVPTRRHRGIATQQWHLHFQQCPAALSLTTPNNSNTSAATPQAARPSHPACSKHRYSPPYPPTKHHHPNQLTLKFTGLHNQTLESHNRRPRMANVHLPLQPPNPENPPRRLPNHRQAPPRLRHDGEILQPRIRL